MVIKMRKTVNLQPTTIQTQWLISTAWVALNRACVCLCVTLVYRWILCRCVLIHCVPGPNVYDLERPLSSFISWKTSTNFDGFILLCAQNSNPLVCVVGESLGVTCVLFTHHFKPQLKAKFSVWCYGNKKHALSPAFSFLQLLWFFDSSLSNLAQQRRLITP